MKKYLTFAMFFVLAVALVSPVSVSAKTKAGTKSGSFFYFFDKALEKTNLFFIFSAEKKAKKALENAEERLAEAEESASENNQEAVETAMKDYQENISLAETEARGIKDETKTKILLSTIASSTSKHQEILTEVLNKVLEEAKEAIEKAIEASKKGREEAMKEEKEVSENKQEVKETDNEIKKEDNEKEVEIINDKKEETKNKDEQKKEIEKLKKEVEALKQKQPQVKIIEKVIDKPVVVEKKEISSSQTKQNENVVTLPNGSVVEMDASGNVVRTIKEIPQTSNTALAPTSQHMVTPATFLIPGSIKVSTSKLNNYMEIALNPQIEHNERIDIIATVKDISGNPVPDQTVVFENGYSSAKSITDSDGIANVCFIADSGGVPVPGITYRQTSIVARVVIPANSTFIQDTILVNAPVDQNLGNLNRMQQGHLYEFKCK